MTVHTRASAHDPASPSQVDNAHHGDILGAFGTISAADVGARTGLRHRLMTLAAIVGPGLIVMVALIDASIIGASAVLLGTAYAIGDVFEVRYSLHHRPAQAIGFYLVFAGLITGAATLVLIPDTPLGLSTNAVQTLAGVLLPSATVFLLLLCIDEAGWELGATHDCAPASLTEMQSQKLEPLMGRLSAKTIHCLISTLHRPFVRAGRVCGLRDPVEGPHCAAFLCSREQSRNPGHLVTFAAITFGLTIVADPATAQTVSDAATPETVSPTRSEDFAVHGQATFVLQGTPAFSSPYVGTNSLAPGQRKETVDVTLYAGVRPWQGGELWINPEIDQGFGLSDTLGVAGFPSAEAYKVGKKHPYVRLQRLFFRQTINLGGDKQPVESEANQLAGMRSGYRLVLTMGKFGVGDIFDTNAYAHDPRGDFLNWSLVDAGSFDYAADAWGYSTGIAAEWYQGPWTLRVGAFNLSKIPNGETLETRFQQYQIDGEIEHRHSIAGHAGAIRITLFRNRGRFGRFDDALALAAASNATPDTGLVRQRRTRAGVSVNLEQAVTDTLGLFARAGLADGQVEPYDFTDIDRTAQVGLSLNGAGWHRAHDTIGTAVVVNGISREHQRYLDAGGLGVLVGDGRLPHPGSEYIGEAFYKLTATKGVELSLDYQFIANPGYNRDRGPANVLALRMHGAF